MSKFIINLTPKNAPKRAFWGRGAFWGVFWAFFGRFWAFDAGPKNATTIF
jgi:hypothetical protein